MSEAWLANIAARDVTGLRIAVKGLSEVRLRRCVRRILDENVLWSIASVTGDNHAQVNIATFCHSGELELYFLSHPASLHCRNLRENSSVGMAIPRRHVAFADLFDGSARRAPSSSCWSPASVCASRSRATGRS